MAEEQQWRLRRGRGCLPGFWLAPLLLSLLVGTAAAQDEVVVEPYLGFDGTVLPGQPAPLTLLIQNRSGLPVDLDVSVQEGGIISFGARYVSRRVQVSPGVARQLTLLVPGSEMLEPLVALRSSERWNFAGTDGHGQTVRQRISRGIDLQLEGARVPQEPQSILLLGPRARQIRDALPAEIRTGTLPPRRRLLDARPFDFLTLDARLAPDSWLAYAGFNIILWTEPDLLEMPNPAQLRALLDWVEYGGHLVILSAARPELLDVDELKAILPARITSTSTIAYPAPRHAEENDWNIEGPRLVTDAPATAEDEADVAVLPTAARADIGSGTQSLALFDPLRYDVGQPEVLMWALYRATSLNLDYGYRPDAEDESTVTGTTGEMNGTLFYRLLANENALTPSIGLLFLFAFLFLLLIGPFDYKFLKKYDKLHLSPWTLLLYTVLFSGLCLGLTFVLFAPDEEVNRLAILDFTEGLDGDESVNGYLYHGVYAPLGGSYIPPPPEFQCFGGLVPEPPQYSMVFYGNPDVPREPQIYLGAGRQPVRLAMPFNSLRVSAHRVSGKPTGSVTVSVERRDQDGLTLVFHNGLPTDLQHGLLVTEDGFHPLPTIAAGETVTRHLTMSNWDRLDTLAGSAFNIQQMRRPAQRAMPIELAYAIYSTSVSLWDLAGAKRVLEAAGGRADWFGDPQSVDARTCWDLSRALGSDHAVFLATTTELPFLDGVEDRPGGFTYVVVRKTIELKS